MKRTIVFVMCSIFLLVGASFSFAIGLELAVGGWSQSFNGDIGYKPATETDALNLEKDLKYDDEIRPTGRLKLDMPLTIPNIYLMYTQIEFSGKGQRTDAFRFGDIDFDADTDFNSRLTLHNYDLTLFYGIPFIEMITLDLINIDVGVNVKVLDFGGEVRQRSVDLYETEEFKATVPMVYVSAQVKPVEKITFEAEARGISYGGDSFMNLIGRFKLKPFGLLALPLSPIFISGGVRYDYIYFDKRDIEVDVELFGPFFEVGIQF